jgi:hypothetical protein
VEASEFGESGGAANVDSVSRLYGYKVSLLYKGKGKPELLNKFPNVTNQTFPTV